VQEVGKSAQSCDNLVLHVMSSWSCARVWSRSTL